MLVFFDHFFISHRYFSLDLFNAVNIFKDENKEHSIIHFYQHSLCNLVLLFLCLYFSVSTNFAGSSVAFTDYERGNASIRSELFFSFFFLARNKVELELIYLYCLVALYVL